MVILFWQGEKSINYNLKRREEDITLLKEISSLLYFTTNSILFYELLQTRFY